MKVDGKSNPLRRRRTPPNSSPAKRSTCWRNSSLRRRHGDGEDGARDGLPALIPNAGANAIHARRLRAEHLPDVVRQQPGRRSDGHGDAEGRHQRRLSPSPGNMRRARIGRGIQGSPSPPAAAKSSKDITLPFPDVEFRSILAEVGSLKPDAVYSFFAGGGSALKFIRITPQPSSTRRSRSGDRAS